MSVLIGHVPCVVSPHQIHPPLGTVLKVWMIGLYTTVCIHIEQNLHGRSTQVKVLNNEVDSIVKLQWNHAGLYRTLPAQKADLTVLA